MREVASGTAFDMTIFRRILKYVNPYKRMFVFTGLLTLLLAILAPFRPWLIQYTVDNFIVEPDARMLLNFTILSIATLIIEAVVQFYQTYMANWVGQSVIKDLRMEVYD